MKKLNLIQNVTWLVLVILLAVTLFIPALKLRLNAPATEETYKILSAANEAYKKDMISEKEYEKIASKLIRAQAEREGIKLGALPSFDENGEVTDTEKLIFTFDTSKSNEYCEQEEALALIYQSEIGDVDCRYEHSQSLFTTLISLPDALTLMGETDEMTMSPDAISKGSVDTYILLRSLTNLGSISAFVNLPAAILAIYCIIIAPITFLVLAIRELISAIKKKKDYFNHAPSDVIEKSGAFLVPLAFFFMLPLLLRGTAFSFLLILITVIAIAWLVLVALTPSVKQTAKATKRFVRTGAIFLAAGIIVSAILGVILINHDAHDDLITKKVYEERREKVFTETFYEDYNELVEKAASAALSGQDKLAEKYTAEAKEKIDGANYSVKAGMIIAPISNGLAFTRIFAALCLIFVLVYIAGSLKRFVGIFHEESPVVLAKYARFIPAVFVAILYNAISSGYSTALIAIILFIVLFAIELAFSIYRNKSIPPYMQETAAPWIEKGERLVENGAISKEYWTKAKSDLSELVSQSKLSKEDLKKLDETIEILQKCELEISSKQEGSKTQPTEAVSEDTENV